MELLNRWKLSGLALFEIIIILVVIGLLLGGVLKGREFIANAKIMRIESDFSGLSAAIHAYQDRYGVLPGDDNSATTRSHGIWQTADNGNGNGRIAGNWNSDDNVDESRKIWKHLRAAALIAGPVDNTDSSFQQPSNPFGGPVGIDPKKYNLNGRSIVFGEIPGGIAQTLDARGDDGVPNTGTIQAHKSQTSYTVESRYDVAFLQEETSAR